MLIIIVSQWCDYTLLFLASFYILPNLYICVFKAKFLEKIMMLAHIPDSGVHCGNSQNAAYFKINVNEQQREFPGFSTSKISNACFSKSFSK